VSNKKEYPMRFTPVGVSDAYDATDSFPGACRILQNLILDQSNSELVVARPGVGLPITSFGAFNTPTQVTVSCSVGNVIYGMVSTALTPGYDQPFAYNIGGAFTTITGITALNVPTSPAVSGDWTPPTMEIIGTKVIVTHPGFSGANFFGVIDISNPAAPVWSAGNTTVHTLPSVPISVSNFNNRAYFSCGNTLWYSDVLAPTVMTNAGQSLTVGDPTPIVAQSGLSVQTSSAGVVGALMVFKQFQIWQVIGDAAISGSLSLNFLSLNVGCVSPRTVTQTPIGTLFIGMDGPYTITPLGAIMALAKDMSKITADIQAPFQSMTSPSRAVGAFSGSIYRVCIETVRDGVNVTDDYWFDITRRRWSGPHTFPYDNCCQVGNYFVLSNRKLGAMFFTSSYLPTSGSVYNDNGSAINVQLKSANFPKTQNINMKQVVESTIELSSISKTLSYLISAVGEDFQQLSSATINLDNNSPIWGIGTWGIGRWTSGTNVPKTYTLNWSGPLVFKKMALQIFASGTSNLSIGTFFAKYRDAGYTNV